MRAEITMIGGEVITISHDDVRQLHEHVTQTPSAAQLGWLTYKNLSINLQNAVKIEFEEDA
ncbi:hypothetical protein D3C72_2355650 [compost metagenome]